MDWENHIVVANAPAGQPVLRGTDVTVDAVLRLLAEGQTEDQVRAAHAGITRDGMRAVYAFAAEATERVILARQP